MNAAERSKLILEALRAVHALTEATRGRHRLYIDRKLVGDFDTAQAALAALERHAADGKPWQITPDPGNLARLIAGQPGLGSGHEPGSGEGDPTGNAVGRPDQPAHDLANFDRILRALYVNADQLRRILDNYGPPRPAGEAERLALARDNAQAEPCCEHCATITEAHSDLPLLMPPDPRRLGPTDVGGRLAKPMLLCRWCVDFVGGHDRLPKPDELAQHRDKGTVRVRAAATMRRPA